LTAAAPRRWSQRMTDDEDAKEKALKARIEADRKESADLKGEIDDLDEAVDRAPPRIDHPNKDGGVF
jgi:hypothetical protein